MFFSTNFISPRKTPSPNQQSRLIRVEFCKRRLAQFPCETFLTVLKRAAVHGSPFGRLPPQLGPHIPQAVQRLIQGILLLGKVQAD